MRKDIKEWARSCLSCQRSKIQRHTKNSSEDFYSWSTFSAYPSWFNWFFPSCQNFRYCLTIIDRFSRWPEAIRLTEISAETVSAAFYFHWLARYGAPQTIATDQGSQFEAALFKALTNLLGWSGSDRSAYHPASNGILERWHRTLKSVIMCYAKENWFEVLPTVLLGLQTFKEDLNASASLAEMLYGST